MDPEKEDLWHFVVAVVVGSAVVAVVVVVGFALVGAFRAWAGS